MNLNDIGHMQERYEVELLDGKMVTLRRIADIEAAAVRRCYPTPRPPTRRDPTKGSRSEPISDEHNPQYKWEMDVWSSQVYAGDFAISVDWTTSDGKKWPGMDKQAEGDRETFIKAAVEEIRSVLPRYTLLRMYEAVHGSKSVTDAALEESERQGN